MVRNKRAFILTKEDYLIDNFCFFATVPIGIWETILETFRTQWNIFKFFQKNNEWLKAANYFYRETSSLMVWLSSKHASKSFFKIQC